MDRVFLQCWPADFRRAAAKNLPRAELFKWCLNRFFFSCRDFARCHIQVKAGSQPPVKRPPVSDRAGKPVQHSVHSVTYAMHWLTVLTSTRSAGSKLKNSDAGESAMPYVLPGSSAWSPGNERQKVPHAAGDQFHPNPVITEKPPCANGLCV